MWVVREVSMRTRRSATSLLRLLPRAMLFRHLIDQSKEAGYAYFDFGISNEDHGQWLNEGLVQQKSRLGGRGIVYNSYQIKL